MQLSDVNDDAFPDLLISVSYIANNQGQSAGYLSCTYMNTGCGWLISSEYTGSSPILGCNLGKTDVMLIRGVAIRVAGLEVHEFTSSIAEEFTIPFSSIVVYAGKGHTIRQGRRVLMDRLVSQMDGFSVSINGTENYYSPSS